MVGEEHINVEICHIDFNFDLGHPRLHYFYVGISVIFILFFIMVTRNDIILCENLSHYCFNFDHGCSGQRQYM